MLLIEIPVFNYSHSLFLVANNNSYLTQCVYSTTNNTMIMYQQLPFVIYFLFIYFYPGKIQNRVVLGRFQQHTWKTYNYLQKYTLKNSLGYW